LEEANEVDPMNNVMPYKGVLPCEKVHGGVGPELRFFLSEESAVQLQRRMNNLGTSVPEILLECPLTRLLRGNFLEPVSFENLEHRVVCEGHGSPFGRR
jgi:hypothetical protein